MLRSTQSISISKESWNNLKEKGFLLIMLPEEKSLHLSLNKSQTIEGQKYLLILSQKVPIGQLWVAEL